MSIRVRPFVSGHRNETHRKPYANLKLREEIVLNHQGLVEKKDVFDDERAVLPASLLR